MYKISGEAFVRRFEEKEISGRYWILKVLKIPGYNNSFFRLLSISM
jgi:hypothetical protein